jgi:predicted ester cyclase
MTMSDAETWRAVATDIIGAGKLDLIDEYFAPDYVEHLAPAPGMAPGRDSFRIFCAELRSAFPDLSCEVVQQFEQGDSHIGHVRLAGTMTGDFFGMPAANRPATWEEMHIAKIKDGKVREHWAVVDQMGLMQQLGFVPAPGGSH